MQSATFAYHRPTSLDEALQLLGSIEGSRPLAGGHSLVPVMKRRLASPGALVDISRVPGLDGISTGNGEVTIGALVTHAAVASSTVVHEHVPVLAEAAGMIGDRQVRNRGTIGGSLAHADPAADYPTVLEALGAEVTVTGTDGERRIGSSDFFVDLFTTAVQPGELVTAVHVPATGDGVGAAYLKHRHPASSYAVVGVAAVLGVGSGVVTSASVAVGGATATPIRATATETGLVGQPAGDESYAAAAAHVGPAITDPIGDVYASGEYRAHLAGVLVRRALAEAAARA